MKRFLFFGLIAAIVVSCTKPAPDPIPDPDEPTYKLTVSSFSPMAAHWGETVTIAGTGFSATASENAVTFNGIAATVISATETALTVEVPKNLECSGALKVEVGDGSVTAKTRFTYLPRYTTVLTIAGNGERGLVDAQGANARFYSPAGVAVDAQGNIIVAEMNHAIRKIDPQGNVTTVAGNGAQGFVDAQGSDARFKYPYGVAIDALGNIIVTDYGNHAIRKIDPQGNVTTIVGNGIAGLVDAQGSDARFYSPAGVVIDASGNIFVADANNNAIRKIDSQGNVTTIAGNGDSGFVDGKLENARFLSPFGVAIDAKGNIIVVDTSNYAIRKIRYGKQRASLQRGVTTIAGGTYGFVDAQGTDAMFRSPRGIAVDALGNIIVADYGNHAIRKIDPQGNVTTIAGNGDSGFVDGNVENARFYSPAGVAIDAVGNIIVADYSSHAIRKITAE